MIRPFPRRLGFPVHPAGGILVLPLSTLGAGLACCQQCLPISNAQESARGQLPKCSPVTSFCHSYCTIIYIGFFPLCQLNIFKSFNAVLVESHYIVRSLGWPGAPARALAILWPQPSNEL